MMISSLLIAGLFPLAVAAFTASRPLSFLVHPTTQLQPPFASSSSPSLNRQDQRLSSRRLFFEADNGGGSSSSTAMGLNELHTQLRDAVLAEDYLEAGRISGLLAQRIYPDYATLSAEDQRVRRRNMSWTGLGAAPWLTDRLDALNYTFPTTIQINSFAAVNAILNDTITTTTTTTTTSSDTTVLSLEERVQQGLDMGIVVSGTTGSGKTLSYAVPLLSILSESLFLRQRLRISDEEAVGDTAGDLVDRISVVTSPRLQSAARKQTKAGGAIATGASISTLGRSGTDIRSPLALVVVPTRELGVQTAMLLYQLVGGNIKDSPTARSGKSNMFKYKGPNGIRIGCVLDDEEADEQASRRDRKQERCPVGASGKCDHQRDDGDERSRGRRDLHEGSRRNGLANLRTVRGEFLNALLQGGTALDLGTR